jgi:hypothetical protein
MLGQHGVKRSGGGFPLRESLQPSNVAVAEPVRIDAVDDDQVELAAKRVADTTLELEHLVEGHLLRQRDADVGG